MNKRILHISLFLMLASTSNVLAQQGIGTNTPHRSAALQIDSQNKGLLIPRMNLGYDASVNKITAPTISIPVKGLLVYNQSNVVNGNSVLVPEGFYYFDGSEWNPISKSYLQSNDHTTITGDGSAATPYKVELKPATDYTNQKVLVTNTEGNIEWVDQGANTDTQTKLTQGTNVSITPNPSNISVGGVNNYTIDVPTATTSTLGVVKPGSGLAIGNDGTLNVTVVDTNTDDQKLTFNSSTNELTIEDGNTVDLSSIDTNTTYSAGNGITLTDTVFNVPVSVTGGGNVISGVTANSTGLEFSTVQIATTDTTYTGGDGITLEGTVFSVPVTTTGTGNVITNVEHTTDGITVTKALIATTDTKTTVSGANGVLVTPTVNTQDTSSTDYKVAVKYAMPQVFYMPAMLFNAQAGQTYSNVDLYAHYVDQFATPFKSSAGASGMIPHVAAATQLEYYITYADPSIIPNSITISADGKLTYSVGTGSQESFAYMTVVFVVKPNAVITVPTTP